ncbi:MAG: PaaI family thioesterase [Solirubrobacterales bacterium]
MAEPIPPHHSHCLGCGDENPASLGPELAVEGERVPGSATLDRRHEGAPGFAHGGALATLLDDTLGSLLLVVGRPAVTGKLEVRYRSPAFLGRRFDVEAWVERISGRKLVFAGEIREDQTTIAEARALFIEVDREHFLQGAGELPEGWMDFGRDELLPW